MKIAVVGVGKWGRNHVRVLKELEKEGLVEEIVVVDVDLGLAREVARRFEVPRYYTDALEAKRKEKLDAAIIAVPTVHHYKVSMDLIDSVDLLIEKPMATTLDQALELVRTAEKEDRVVAVGHIERFNPVVAALKKHLEEEDREIVFIKGERLGPGPPSGKYETYMSVAHDLLIHDIDIVVSLLREYPSRVQAISFASPNYPYEVDISAIYEFPRGIASFLRASWRTSPTFKKRHLVVYTRDSAVSIDYILRTMVLERGLSEHRLAGDYAEILTAYKHRELRSYEVSTSEEHEPLLLEDRHFVNCVEKHERPLVSEVEGYVALKCVLAAREAAARRKSVDLLWNEDFL